MLGKLRDKLPPCFRMPSGEQRRRCGPMLLVLGIGLGLTLALFVVMRRWEHRDQQKEFHYAANHYVQAIRLATERILLTHKIMRQDYYGSPSVSRKEFSLLCEPSLAMVPSLKVLQWAPRVRQDERTAFERTARAEGQAGYRIVQPNAAGKLIPAALRKDYFPIWYAASKTGFEAIRGWDFAADPVLQKAIDQCRDTDTFVVSDVIDLSNIGIKQPVVQTFLPVYRDFETVRTVANRRTHLAGFLVGLCEVDDLVERALAYSADPQGVDVTLFDESAPNGRQSIYYHASRRRAAQDAGREVRDDMDSSDIRHAETLAFGGRQWTLVCSPAPEFFATYAGWRSWAALLIGLVVSAASAAYTLAATTRTQRIQRLVDQRTAELRKKDDELRQSQKLEAVGALGGRNRPRVQQSIAGHQRLYPLRDGRAQAGRAAAIRTWKTCSRRPIGRNR